MLVRSKWSKNARVTAFSNNDNFSKRLARCFRLYWLKRQLATQTKVPPGASGPFSVDRTDCGIPSLASYDIVNLHWVAGFVDFNTFFVNNRDTSVVWRFSDLNPITGGCHYDAGCGKYLERCYRCPQLGSKVNEDISSGIWLRKQEAFKKHSVGNLHFVAQSNWMAGKMKMSPLVGHFPVTVIANGVDTDIFKPVAGFGLRSCLGIAEEDTVLLFVATSTHTERKGFSYLVKAIANLDSKVWILSVGNNEPTALNHQRHIWLGQIDNELLLTAVYNTANLFVLPSLQDNLPNTAIESIACGTPVVGFDSGGISDIVTSGGTGELVPRGDIKELSHAIKELVKDGARRAKSMRSACRAKALSDFHLPSQVRKFHDLYKNIIDGKKQHGRFEELHCKSKRS